MANHKHRCKDCEHEIVATGKMETCPTCDGELEYYGKREEMPEDEMS